VSTEIIVSRTQHRLWLVRSGALIFETPVGIGRPATPTPAGHFWVREAFPVPADAPAYGPFAIGTSAYAVLPNWPGGGVVGIHGTNQPALVPGRASYGCIVLRNQRMAALAPLVPLGTPVLIH
jgi:lipoprotein-anchoring transpeptidase ErfK/SrfK